MSDNPSPPYVVFEYRTIEDRAASIEAGHFVGKEVAYALITPAGTKDRFEKEAEVWLRDLAEAVQQERFPAAWLTAYKQAFKDWQEARETPENGTAITGWPAISQPQARMLLDLNFRTVEQLAEATEEGIGRMGMGGRALKAKAQAYLDASNGPGKVAAELDELRVQIQTLVERDAAREAELSKLQAENEALKKASK
jgi:hypothetical protein